MQFLIADDHALLRDALALALEAGFAGADIEACATWDGVHRCIESRRFDLILLDLYMPRRRAWEDELGRLVEAAPDTPVCILTASVEPDHIHAAAAAGIRAYLTKTLDTPEILAALHLVLEGQTVFPPLDGPAPAGDGLGAAMGLTSRQGQILERLATGASNREIADALGLTETTVKRHVLNICRKLGARNRLEAVAVAHARGLLTRY
jgi:DNA-binding NarL/FixJ family response regulator